MIKRRERKDVRKIGMLVEDNILIKRKICFCKEFSNHYESWLIKMEFSYK